MQICGDHFSLTNADDSESTYQLISGTVHFLAPLKGAVGSVVGRDLLFNGGGVVAPGSHLNHALQICENKIESRRQLGRIYISDDFKLKSLGFLNTKL